MAQVARLNIDLVARTGKLTSGFDKGKRSVKDFSRSTASAAVGIRAIGPAAGVAAVGLTTLASAAAPLLALFAGFKILTSGIGFITSSVKGAAQFETMTVSFETMLKSADKAKTLLDELNKFSNVTPFEVTEIQEAAKVLLGFKVSADDVLDRVKLMGDLSAGSGAKIIEFVRIFGKVKSTGRVSLENINELGMRSVDVFGELKVMLGKDEDELRKFISAGKVKFPDLLRAMESMTSEAGLFADAMVKQSTTLNGLWSTITGKAKDSMREMGEAIVEGLDLKSAAAGMIEFIDKVSSGFSANKDAIIASIKGWVSFGMEAIIMFVDVIDTIRLAFKGVQTAVISLVAFQAEAWATIIEAVEDVAGFIAKGFNIAFASATVAMQAFVSNSLKGLAKLGEWMEAFAPDLADQIAEVFQDTRIPKDEQLSLSELTSGVSKDFEVGRGSAAQALEDAIAAEKPDLGIGEAARNFADSLSLAAKDSREEFMADFTSKSAGERLRSFFDSFASKSEAAKSEEERQAAKKEDAKTGFKVSTLSPAALQKGTVAAFSSILKAGKAATKTQAEIELIAEQKRQTKLLRKIDDALSNPPEVLSIA